MQRAEFFDVSSERWQAKVSGAVTLDHKSAKASNR